MIEGRIQPGFYKGRAVAGSEQYGTTKTGTDQIALDLRVPRLNRVLTTFLYFTDASAPYAFEKLRACGWEGSDLMNLAGIDKNEIDVAIKYEVYNGQENMKVEIATGAGRVTLDSPMSEPQKRAFAARMKGFLAGAGPASAPKQAQRSRTSRHDNNPDFDPNAGARDDDKIPF